MVIERGSTVCVFRVIGACYDRNVHNPPAAFFAGERGLLHPVPEPAVMYGKISCCNRETGLLFIRRMVDKIFLFKEKGPQTLVVRTG